MTETFIQEDTDTQITHPPMEGHYNPVTVTVNANEVAGVFVLGGMVFLLLVALLRSRRRERKMIAEVANLYHQLEKVEGLPLPPRPKLLK
jgi:hypothetical protein